ncbi:sensor domain-containing protein [Pseudoduganella chitinolytica]|uniref:EAL domain-containing protein n=1 Tax=Pseudoduganella chitinolytica TaxID=34070 RepID=A0ABY8BKX5_9BURK|nr:EAL domain-containing protein [Pseudoduganella chitinolytica]WEF34929.1 EAL domain-containing protein [Pseudoduganella chitinolytica]
MSLAPLPLAVLVVDASGAVISWNKAFEKLAGYGPDEVRGRDLAGFVEFDEPVQLFSPTLAQANLAGRLLCARGCPLPVRLTVAPQSLDTEEPGKYSVIVLPLAGEAAPRNALLQDFPVAELIENLPCVFYVIDQSGHLLLWNRQLEHVLERSSEELPTTNVSMFFDASEHQLVRDNILAAFELGSSSHEAELLGKHGKRTTCLFNCARTSLGNVPCVFGTGLDISARKKTEQGLRVSERAMYSSVNAIIITCCSHGDNLIEYVNPAFEQMTGYELAEIKGRDPRFMRLQGCDLHEHERIRVALRGKTGVHVVLRNIKRSGEIFWNDLRIDPVINIDGQVTHFVAVINDVTQSRQYERRLHHLAHHDALTGLANRTLLQERLKHALHSALHGGAAGALAFVDLDNFKHINDTFGHDAGDAVLREIADRLRAGVRDNDTVARLGGDEFVVLLDEPPDETVVADLLERLRHCVDRPILLRGKELIAGASFGVAMFPRDGDTMDRIMRAADAAMYHAKTLGKNNVQFYSTELSRVVHQHWLLEANLSRAIRNREMVLGYQPKVDLRTGRVVGAEALVRWHSPERGVVGPDKFIPIAEQTGLIVPLGDWVIGEACATLRSLATLGVVDFVISVNLSARQLRQRHFVEHLATTLREHSIAPNALELEVTESQLMDNPAAALEALAQLKALGVRLSIDDFGTGYSSLSYLQKFPVDVIKIDRSFLGDVASEGDAVIARAIIALGHNLKLEVIAEGVETREQLAFLQDHECDQMQGYYFSPALPQDRLSSMVCNDVRMVV